LPLHMTCRCCVRATALPQRACKGQARLLFFAHEREVGFAEANVFVYQKLTMSELVPNLRETDPLSVGSFQMI